MSVREEVIGVLLYRMKQIGVSNGYKTDIGVKAREWSPAIKEKEQLPLLEVHDARCTTNSDRAGAHTKRLEVEIVVVAQPGVTRSETGLATDEGTELEARTDNIQREMQQYLDDILKALGEAEADLRGALPINRIDLMSDEIGVYEENERFGELRVKIEIEYPCKMWEQ